MACLEAASVGPHTRWFNERVRLLALDAGLVGGPESRVEAVLGRSDFVSPTGAYDTGGRLIAQSATVYEYDPYPFLPMSKFQVFAQDGGVTGFELYDD